MFCWKIFYWKKITMSYCKEYFLHSFQYQRVITIMIRSLFRVVSSSLKWPKCWVVTLFCLFEARLGRRNGIRVWVCISLKRGCIWVLVKPFTLLVCSLGYQHFYSLSCSKLTHPPPVTASFPQRLYSLTLQLSFLSWVKAMPYKSIPVHFSCQLIPRLSEELGMVWLLSFPWSF